MKAIKQKTKIVLVLLFLSPILAELSTGSAPPTEFFNPVVFITFLLLYGCGTLIIREMRSRWSLQWSVLFLAIAFGIFEEGVMTQAIFNIYWPDVGPFAVGYQAFGIIIPWTILVLTFHAVVSTLFPILIVDLIWPEQKKQNLLSKKGMFWAMGGFFFIVVFGRLFFQEASKELYSSNILHLSGCLTVISTLVYLAYRFKNKIIESQKKILSPNIFSFTAYTFSSLYALAPYVMVSLGVGMLPVILFQSTVLVLALLFMRHQIFNKYITRRHHIALAYGSMVFWITFAVLTGIDGLHEMFFVALVYLFIAIKWRTAVVNA